MDVHAGAAAPTATDHPVIISEGLAPLTRQALAGDIFGLRRRVPQGATVALVGRRSRLIAAAIVALEGWAARVELAGELDRAVISAQAVVLREDEIDEPASIGTAGADPRTRDDAGGRPTTWRLFSSGTTGTPTPTDHAMASLARRTQPADRRPAGHEHRRWGLLYPPARMAGIQVLLQAVHGGDSVVDAGDSANLDERIERFARSGVNALSATPTMWRMILRSRACDDLSLRQVTLGGEAATQRMSTHPPRPAPPSRSATAGRDSPGTSWTRPPTVWRWISGTGFSSSTPRAAAWPHRTVSSARATWSRSVAIACISWAARRVWSTSVETRSRRNGWRKCCAGIQPSTTAS